MLDYGSAHPSRIEEPKNVETLEAMRRESSRQIYSEQNRKEFREAMVVIVITFLLIILVASLRWVGCGR
jgi:hypothetical protein